MQTKKVLGGMTVVACALFAGSAMAYTIGDCQNMNGYANGKLADGVPIQPTFDNTWSTVRANSAAFISNKRLNGACVVKEVESPKDRRAPTTGSYTVPGTETAPYIAQDECSLLNTIAQIHSKLGNGKLLDALTTNQGLMDKVLALKGTKLDNSAFQADAIYNAAAKVDACILDVLY